MLLRFFCYQKSFVAHQEIHEVFFRDFNAIENVEGFEFAFLTPT